MVNRKNSKRTSRSKKSRFRSLVLESLQDRHLLAGVATLLKDVNPGSGGSNPESFAEFQGEVIFAVNGTELWKTDGTSSGTVLIKDIGGSLGSYAFIGDIVPVNGQVAIGVLDNDGTPFDKSDDQVTLWKSDGTTSGTVLVKDFGPMSSVGDISDAAFLVELNGKVYGAVKTSTSGTELWRSDLTSTGTVIVNDIVSGAVGSYPEDVTALGGQLFFSANNIFNGRELWTSDGTSSGTVMLEDLKSGTYGSYPRPLTPFGGEYYFGAVDIGADVTPGTADDVSQLWKTDGTTGGATMVDSFGADSFTPFPNLTVAGSTLFGVVNTAANGSELWMTDGTTGGAQLVKEIRSGSDGSYPYYLTNVNGTLFFSANDGTNGNELWKSNGTSMGTVMVKDIFPGSSSYGAYGSAPRELTDVNGTLFFSANDASNGGELWKSDGTSTGTVIVQDIFPGSGSVGAYGSYPYDLTLANGTLYFAASDATNGREPWILNVTEPDKIGFHRGDRFYLDVNGNGAWNNFAGGDAFYRFGNPGDTPIAGDWDGDAKDEIGFHRGNKFYLDVNGNGQWDNVAGGDAVFTFGNAGDVPVIGDWDGNGTDNIGFHRGDRFYLDVNGNGVWNNFAGGDAFYRFGNAGDTPIAGDWNGNGTDSIGFHRGDRFYLDVNGNGAWNNFAGGDAFYRFGNAGDTPIIGDWAGDGTDNIGFHRGDRFYQDVNGNGAWNNFAGGDAFYRFGNSGDTPIIGNWATPGPLLAVGGAAQSGEAVVSLTTAVLDPTVAQAAALWTATGLNATQQQSLANVTFHVADLPGALLGLASGSSITLDEDAAGYGWFVDSTPADNEEFDGSSLIAAAGSEAADRIDLLTVVMHEMGHVLGYGHDDDLEVLIGALAVGTRRLL